MTTKLLRKKKNGGSWVVASCKRIINISSKSDPLAWRTAPAVLSRCSGHHLSTGEERWTAGWRRVAGWSDHSCWHTCWPWTARWIGNSSCASESTRSYWGTFAGPPASWCRSHAGRSRSSSRKPVRIIYIHTKHTYPLVNAISHAGK